MSLKLKIEAEIKSAMLSKDKERLTPLRAIKALILLEESEIGMGVTLDEETETKILTKAAKQRKDSLEIYVEQNRPNLAEKEASELKVIEEFLPKQMDESELEEALKALIAEVGATGPKDMGLVMGSATKKFAGKADGKAISILTKKLLG